MTAGTPESGPLVELEEVPEWLAPLVRHSSGADGRPDGHPGGVRHRAAQADARVREAAVLALFGQTSDGRPDVLLLRRADGLNSHPGQVGFPGGGIDSADRGPVAAAVREASEEVGVDASGVRPVALWPRLYVPPSGFLVTPVIAHWPEPSPVAAVDPGETAAVARVPVDWLVEPTHRIMVRLSSGYAGPAFLAPGMLVWGFTGGLLSGLLDAAGWSRPWNHEDIRSLDEAWLAARNLDDTGAGCA